MAAPAGGAGHGDEFYDLDPAKIPLVIREKSGANPHTIQQLFGKKGAPELREDWKTLAEDADYTLRDSLYEQMLRKGVEPRDWMAERNTEYGLYPDVEDPEFARRLYKKTEFASLSSKAVPEDTCTQGQKVFETTAVQRLVARFLHPSTPYNGLLLNHGVGVGKTCSAITVAETYLEQMPHNKVYILAPQAIADGFRRTIFNVDRLKPTTRDEFALTGERWKSPQCTGMTYLHLTGTAASESKTEIEKEVTKLVRTRYEIMGYRRFANMVEALMNRIPAHIIGAARDDEISALLTRMFADHLIIVDEAHNLRDAAADAGAAEIGVAGVEGGAAEDADAAAADDAADGKKLTPILRKICAVCEGLRLMLMTATPMYNTAPEIIFLLNLLILNDTKDRSRELVTNQIFHSSGEFTAKGEGLLAAHIRRYVSYMRGENPNTFPLRLTPDEKGGDTFMAAYPEISISRREGEVHLGKTDISIMAELPLIVHNVGPETKVGEILSAALEANAKPREARAGDASELTDFMLDQTMQIGNFVYPNGQFGNTGWNAHFELVKDVKAGAQVHSYKWKGEGAIEACFAGAGLASHAPKIASIVKSITEGKGISFLFSRYVMSGALPMAIALEMAGWCRVLADGTPAPLLHRPAGAPKPKHYYVLLTSNKFISPNFAGLVEYATTFRTSEEAEKGTKVKAIIGSQVASEGLDLKCIRQLHLLDGWYHLNRIEQIEGRGVRFCSHMALPLAERNCLIFLHVLNVPKYETADLYAYRLAVRKAQPIGRVTRLMKMYAWDCFLNHEAILLGRMPERDIVDARGKEFKHDLKDRPFTGFCDFAEDCTFKCAGRGVTPKDVGADDSTAESFDYKYKFLKKQERLAEIFSKETALPLTEVAAEVFWDIPWSLGAIGLRNMLGTIRIRRKDGIYGTLIYQNGYILFQPEQVTDHEIPLALRHGRAYGKLPRSISLARGALLETAAPAKVAAEVTEEGYVEGVEEKKEDEEHAAAVAKPEKKPKGGKKAAAVEKVGVAATVLEEVDYDALAASALKSLSDWRDLVDRMIAEPVGKLPKPAQLGEETFQGWRWLFHHFGSLPETREIAAMWWMDNLWTSAERSAVLRAWTMKAPTGADATLAKRLEPTQLFAGAGLKGYSIFNTETLKLEHNCMTARDTAPATCSSTLLEIVEGIMGKPLDRVTDLPLVFGFLVTKEKTVVFKTLHKPSAKGSLVGAECANTSQLASHHLRIETATEELRTLAAADPIVPLLLDISKEGVAVGVKERKDRQEAVKARFEGKASAAALDFKHITDLSLRQVCPYTEFLLRYMDLRRVGGKRWMLSLVDSARATPDKPKIKMT